MEATELLKLIREFIDSHAEIGETSHIMYDPDKLEKEVSFAILEKNEEGNSFKRFSVTIKDCLTEVWVPIAGIESRYANKIVNNKFYGTVTIDGLNENKILSTEDFVSGEPGYIYAPFICKEHTEESLKDYHEFMTKYKKEHAICPKCGATEHSTTLMGYVLYSDKRDEYKDLNTCVCSECGDIHTTHKRVPNPFKK